MAASAAKDEEKILAECVARPWTGALNVLEIRSRLGGEADSSAIYRALSNDDRFERVKLPGALALFRVRR